MNIYKIQDTITGKFFTASGNLTKRGKAWSERYHALSHLRSVYNFDRKKYKDAVLVTYQVTPYETESIMKVFKEIDKKQEENQRKTHEKYQAEKDNKMFKEIGLSNYI